MLLVLISVQHVVDLAPRDDIQSLALKAHCPFPYPRKPALETSSTPGVSAAFTRGRPTHEIGLLERQGERDKDVTLSAKQEAKTDSITPLIIEVQDN